jgi:hypothetical protein
MSNEKCLHEEVCELLSIATKLYKNKTKKELESELQLDCEYYLPETNYKKIGKWVEEPFESLLPVTYDIQGNLILHKYIRYRCSICGRTVKEIEPYCHCGAEMLLNKEKEGN